MKKRFFAIAIVIIIIVTAGLVFLFSRGDENNVVPSMVDSIGEYEKIIGNPDDASVIVYEYADYGCGHCADWNNVMNELYEKYDGKLVIVFRSYNIGFKNGLAAAKAATAADLQGYWKEYKDLLFKNQAEWLYANASGVEDIFVEYFNTASGGKGDVEKFKSDMNGEAVLARLAYEQEMGDKIELSATPTFRIGGQKVALSDVVSTIEKLMDKE